MKTGIEAINFYGGSAFVDVKKIFEMRELDLSRFENLMIHKKSVRLPCEDPVTNGVNAAKQIIDALSEEEKKQIEMVITCTESGMDFGKSMSTYIHDYLDLSRNCRLFEMKQACYSATAALQLSAAYVRSNENAKVLVVSTDVAKASVRNTYAEPSQAEGAIAMIISTNPQILELDYGASGIYGYEVMDTCRPASDLESGDADLSLLSYLDCLENSFHAYGEKVEEADFIDTFGYLVFHTPFPGMVKGAHRKMLRELYKMKGNEIEEDFMRRVLPSLSYNMQVGNVYAASVYLGICGLIEKIRTDEAVRIGIFSYGSGCSSEFYSGVLMGGAYRKLEKMNIEARLNDRYELSNDEYELLLQLNQEWDQVVCNKEVELKKFRGIYKESMENRGLLRIEKVDNYHRSYVWS